MASGTSSQPVESLLNNKISELCKIVTINTQSYSGLSITMSASSTVIFLYDQYKRIYYVRAVAGEAPDLTMINGEAITPIVNGRNIKLPTGSWVFFTMIVTCATAEGLNSMTIERYS